MDTYLLDLAIKQTFFLTVFKHIGLQSPSLEEKLFIFRISLQFPVAR